MTSSECVELEVLERTTRTMFPSEAGKLLGLLEEGCYRHSMVILLFVSMLDWEVERGLLGVGVGG